MEKYDLELANMDTMYFKNPQTQELHNEFKRVNRILKSQIISKYRSWEFNYYQTKWIITNHKNFVYYVNELFYYMSMKETTRYYTEIDDAILKSYEKIRSNYRRVKILVNR